MEVKKNAIEAAMEMYRLKSLSEDMFGEMEDAIKNYMHGALYRGDINFIPEIICRYKITGQTINEYMQWRDTIDPTTVDVVFLYRGERV